MKVKVSEDKLKNMISEAFQTVLAGNKLKGNLEEDYLDKVKSMLQGEIDAYRDNNSIAGQIIKKYGFIRYEQPEGVIGPHDYDINENRWAVWGWRLFEAHNGKLFFVVKFTNGESATIAQIDSVQQFERLCDCLGIILKN